MDIAAGGLREKMCQLRNFYLLICSLGVLFSFLRRSWSHRMKHTMSSSDSLISACTALSNPPTGTHYNAAFFLSPAGVLTPLGTPVVQNLNGPTMTFIREPVKKKVWKITHLVQGRVKKTCGNFNTLAATLGGWRGPVRVIFHIFFCKKNTKGRVHKKKIRKFP